MRFVTDHIIVVYGEEQMQKSRKNSGEKLCLSRPSPDFLRLAAHTIALVQPILSPARIFWQHRRSHDQDGVTAAISVQAEENISAYSAPLAGEFTSTTEHGRLVPAALPNVSLDDT